MIENYVLTILMLFSKLINVIMLLNFFYYKIKHFFIIARKTLLIQFHKLSHEDLSMAFYDILCFFCFHMWTSCVSLLRVCFLFMALSQKKKIQTKTQKKKEVSSSSEESDETSSESEEEKVNFYELLIGISN